MTIKHKPVGQPTGIYQESTWYSNLPDENAQLEEMYEYFKKNETLKAKLQEVEADAKAVLEAEGYCDLPVSLARSRWIITGRNDSGEPLAPRARDALELLSNLDVYRELQEAGQVEKTSVLLLNIGKLFERIHVRPAEPAVRRGLAIAAGGRKGTVIRYGTEADRAKCWQSYRQACDEMHKRKPALTWNAVCDNVARDLKISVSTIKRHCRKSW